jgi:hypothetical protein
MYFDLLKLVTKQVPTLIPKVKWLQDMNLTINELTFNDAYLIKM